MRKLLIASLLLSSVYCKAQQTLAFPFQGGSTVMNNYFRDSTTISPEIVKARATGMAIIKFTADIKGNVSKFVIYYADDYLLTTPAIEVLKKSNTKWVIPDKEEQHDFILPFSFSFRNPAAGTDAVEKAAYDYYKSRKPIMAYDQLPLNSATLLPAVVIKYDAK